MTVHCTYHCANCDRHFVSLSGFDRHRVGSWDERECVDPEGLGMISTPGLCDLRGKVHEGAVWTTRSTD